MLPRVRMIALSAALLLPSLAHADDVSRETIIAPESPQLVRRSELVVIGDLDLRSDRGQVVLMRRLHHAAKDVCGPVVDSRALRDVQDFHSCYDTAMADATFKLRTFVASAQPGHESVASLVVVGAMGQ